LLKIKDKRLKKGLFFYMQKYAKGMRGQKQPELAFNATLPSLGEKVFALET
jgi:hypothetical protein